MSMWNYIKTWLTRNKEIIAHVFSIIGLFLVGYQLIQVNEHKRWENYNALNQRYYEWYSNIPPNMEIDTCVPFEKRSQEIKKWARTYFDLYSEEYWLYLNNLIPNEMWTKRIDNGVDVNLISYPLLVRGYKYWKNQGSFVHPDEFIALVDNKLKKLNSQLRMAVCEPK